MSDKKHHRHDLFEIIHENFAHGMHANISIVKRKSDKKLVVWKRPIADKPEHHEAIRKEVKRAKKWKKFGVSKVEVYWHPDKQSLLKTYIEGKTLRQILDNDQEFFSKKESKPIKTLAKFIEHLIDSKHYINNLSCENLVFDGNRWHVIDSSEIKKIKSHSDIKRKYKRNLLEIWSRGLRLDDKLRSDDKIHILKLFLERYCK